MFESYLDNVRNKRPVVHCITNYVTANDCANVLLALNASPIMADAPEEADEITGIAAGLCINLGTLSKDRADAMLKAGKKANAMGIPVVLDPVGVAASGFRIRIASKLLNEVHFSLIRGNVSEIRALAGECDHKEGIDVIDALGCDIDETINLAEAFAKKTGAVIVLSGKTDIVTDGKETFCINNGHPDMARVTGTGCMLSSVIAAFLAANTTSVTAGAAAVCAYGLAGEMAHKRLGSKDGNATYRNYIIDAAYNLTEEDIKEGAKYEMR